MTRVRITGGLGGLTPLIKTWTAPKRGQNNRLGGIDTRPGEEVDPTDCHCIICTVLKSPPRPLQCEGTAPQRGEVDGSAPRSPTL